MSKRGSRNALNFSGKSWSVGGKFSKSRLKKKKSDNKRKARDARRKAKFDLICEKFDFQIKKIEDKQLYDRLLKQFIELKAMKGSRVANRSVENVEHFRSLCSQEKIEFNIKVYFDEKYNHLDFAKMHPELKPSKLTTTKNKRELNKKTIVKKNNSLSDLISEETLSKLKNIVEK